jgi:CPA2 family monovalent cation:H+ antiporter-2
MAQIGEFSFIIANLGRSSGVTDATLYPIAVAVSTVTTFLTPYLLRSAHATTAFLSRYSPRPLQTFATFYTAWVARLTTRAPRSERILQGLLLRLALYLVVAVSLFIVMWGGLQPFVQLLPELFPGQNVVVRWGSAAIVVLPFLFLISRTLERVIQAISEKLLRRPTDEAAGQRQLVRDTLRFLFSGVAAVFVLAVCVPVLPPLVPLGGVIVGLLITSYFFFGSLSRFHARIENVLSTLGGSQLQPETVGTQPQVTRRTEVTQLLSDQYGLAVQTEDFVVPFASTALNRPIRTLGLRSLTGASIIAIYRDDEHVLVPQADSVLLPGDVLVLLGEKDQLETALRFLTQLAAEKPEATITPPQIASVFIGEGSPFAHQTLAELNGQEELGVLIVGVQRGEEQIANPGPDFQVQPGDTLYLWGPLDRVETAQNRAIM